MDVAECRVEEVKKGSAVDAEEINLHERRIRKMNRHKGSTSSPGSPPTALHPALPARVSVRVLQNACAPYSHAWIPYS